MSRTPPDHTAPDAANRDTESLASLPGLGGKRVALLAKLKIESVEDLLLHRPRRYEDRRHCATIGDAQDKVPAVFQVTVQSVRLKRLRHRRLTLLEVRVADESGELTCRWWNQTYLAKTFQEGMALLVFGKPILGKIMTIDQPDVEIIEGASSQEIHLNRIVPVYPLTQGITQRWLREFIWTTLTTHADRLPDHHAELTLPYQQSRSEALRQLHFPDELENSVKAFRYFAQEELVDFQIQLQRRRQNFIAKAHSPQCSNSNAFVRPFLQALPFNLTQAQERVLQEIRKDLNRSIPMRRLLQGDVGSGKTVVAAIAALMMLESGYDVALMVPTELLARQHLERLAPLLAHLQIDTFLCTAQPKSPASTEPPSKTPDDTDAVPAALTIGTHALLEAGYAPPRLGMVIIDEQHRFGVSQRDRLLRKGRYPHLLTMTATPIPRSLGLTVYGDLEHSIIDELPAGRGSVTTYVRGLERLDRIWAFVHREVSEGRQAYVIYPRIKDDNDQSELKSLETEFAAIKKRLPDLQVDYLHGKVDRDRSAQKMEAFRQQQIQVLVATTVIEVGVDVPNATIMLIENAERFGLAQLHQLRGRIGRGAHESHCILVSHEKNEAAWERLKIMESTQNGFEIAEYDLRHRGPGEFLGKQQSGLPRFRFADLVEHRTLVGKIRQIVRQHLGLETLSP